MTLFDYSPGQQLDTSGGMRYVVLEADESSVTFRVEGFDGVRVVGRKQFDRLTKGARLLRPAGTSPAHATVNERGAER